MFENMALPQPPGSPCRIAVTVLRWTRYALALDDKTMALPQSAAPASEDDTFYATEFATNFGLHESTRLISILPGKQLFAPLAQSAEQVTLNHLRPLVSNAGSPNTLPITVHI
jgi:hypothetical protein